MSTHRETDALTRTRFRMDRFFCDKGLWYFNTREQTVEGPYATRESAEHYQRLYVTLTRISGNLDLSLEPIEGAGPQQHGKDKVWDFNRYSARFTSAA